MYDIWFEMGSKQKLEDYLWKMEEEGGNFTGGRMKRNPCYIEAMSENIVFYSNVEEIMWI